MNIFWLSWKDIKHHLAGGAEVVTDQILSRLATNGHKVTLLTSGYENASNKDEINGYEVLRMGNRLTVYREVRKYLKKLTTRPDLLIEEVNTIPFFSQWVLPKTRRYLFFHQLARQIWFYQMFFPLSLFGYLLEPIYLRLLNKNLAITVSNSTKKDLMRHGFKVENISIISEGITLTPIPDLKRVKKYDKLTVLSLGAVRAMKRTLEQIKAFEFAKEQLPELEMIVAGSTNDKYGQKVKDYAQRSRFKDSIQLLGRIDESKKLEVMRRCHVLLVTSTKEGWCLVVTEANSQGTPAVVYNVDGLRDSVQENITGLISPKNQPKLMAGLLVLILKDQKRYERIRQKAWEESRKITFEQCYRDFIKSVGILDGNTNS